MSNCFGKEYIRNIPDKTRQNKLQIGWSPKLNAFKLKDIEKQISVKIGTVDDYFKYMVGETSHLFSNYDPKLHTITAPYSGDVSGFFDHGIPFELNEHSKETSKLPYGQYRLEHSRDHGVLFKKIEVNTDTYIPLKKDVSNKIYDDLQTFIKNKPLFEKEKVRHKKGTLLYGPPGNGKTREIEQILEKSADDKIYSFFIPSSFGDLERLDVFKSILKNETIVFILEEITERTSGCKMEELLSFLDGETSWNNCYVIATTNYPEDLPANVVDRPGRFGSIIEFSNPTKEERIMYLLGRGYDEMAAIYIADLTNGLSLDYLVQSVTQSRINNITIEQYLKESKETRVKVSKSFKNSIGI